MARMLQFLFILVTLLTNYREVNALSSELQLILTSITQCKNETNLPIVIDHWDIVQKTKSNYYITGNINITKEFPQGFEVYMRVDKCPNDARLGNCDIFLNNFSIKNVCYMFHSQKAHLMDFFLDEVQPKFSCPLAVGIYSVNDVRIDETLIKYLPQLGSTFWRIALWGELGTVKVACIDVTASIRPRRTKKHIAPKRN